MGVDLRHITSDPDIATLRNQTGADLVCFFRGQDTGRFGGRAWILRDPSGESQYGFSVVSARSAGGGFLFQHEIGHNLGGAHDRDNSDIGGLNPYSHGHRYTAPNGFEYRTVMAYPPGNPINYFSNPNISFEGSPTGVASGSQSADNAKTFSNTVAVVAAYREHIHQEPIADAGSDITAVDIDGNGSEIVKLDGSSSEVEWGEPVWTWSWDGGEALGPVVEQAFPVGETIVTLTATDVEGY